MLVTLEVLVALVVLVVPAAALSRRVVEPWRVVCRIVHSFECTGAVVCRVFARALVRVHASEGRWTLCVHSSECTVLVLQYAYWQY